VSEVDLEEFAQSLRSGLGHAAAGMYPSPGFDDMFGRRVRRRRRRTSIAAAAAMAVAATAGILFSVEHHGSAGTTLRYSTQPTGEAAGVPWSWTPLPPAPIDPRIQDFTVWTGSQLVIWGGAGTSAAVSAQGASYEPATSTWRSLPAAPISGRVGPVGVWTGTEVVIYGGTAASGQPNDGAAYDPASRTWRKLPAAPLGNLSDSGSYTVWTGSRMLAWGFFGTSTGTAHANGSRAVASFDPATEEWTVGPAAPVEAPLFGDAFWTGREMIVVGSEPGSGSGPPPDIAVAYNPITDTWSQLPVPPLPGARTDELAAWDGTELILGGGFSSGATRALDRDAAAYNPSTNTWRRLPDAPQGFSGSARYPDVWTGRYVVAVDDGDPQGRPLVLDPAKGTWRLGSPASQPTITEAPAIWTGTSIIRWSGGTPQQTNQPDASGCCEFVTGGEAFTVAS
jgi:hypothetical protein